MMDKQSNYANYANAYQVAVSKFNSRTPAQIADTTGAVFNEHDQLFYLTSFGQQLAISYPDGQIWFKGTDKKPVFSWRLIVINYLGRSSGKKITGKPISYRDLAGGNVYYPALQRDVIRPFTDFIQHQQLEMLKRASQIFGGSEAEGKGDLTVKINSFPNFPITINIWWPDEELQGSVNVLFDETANEYLHTEDVAVLVELAMKFWQKEAVKMMDF